eukprot:CAMPEP_0198267228 /NCGR_PEP_ID=MMETSP1447-20131203/32108_1 /TAXON_ID=420782 /ORGANISM="Chaetoceros dichaeta, Strain CCMP1751" /LENGTH=567 /DNA_ID=CAMNT_0043957725 /DNA_START=45 /DNA_END=1748 /DNA_ORIENTATION=+
MENDSPLNKKKQKIDDDVALIDSGFKSLCGDDAIVIHNGEPMDAMLVNVCPCKGIDKFFVLQLIGRKIYARYGITGTSDCSVNDHFTQGSTSNDFTRMFHCLTGVKWEMRNTSPAVPKRYCYVKQSYLEKRIGYQSAKWQYFVNDDDDDAGKSSKLTEWSDFIEPALYSSQLEQLYQEHIMNPHLPNRTVADSFGNGSYQVSFKNMTQINLTRPKNSTSRHVKIRRCPFGGPQEKELEMEKIKGIKPPKGPRDSYSIFADEMRPKISAEFPNRTGSQAATDIFKTWSALSNEKMKNFGDMMKADKERFNMEMQEYNKYMAKKAEEAVRTTARIDNLPQNLLLVQSGKDSSHNDGDSDVLKTLMESIPNEVQLIIYDAFLDIRNYQCQRSAKQLSDRLIEYSFIDCGHLNEIDLDSSAFSKEVAFDIDHLPRLIRCSFDLYNKTVGDFMDYGGAQINKYIFDGFEEVGVLLLRVSTDGSDWMGCYDARTYKCMYCAGSRSVESVEKPSMENVLNEFREEDFTDQGEQFDEVWEEIKEIYELGAMRVGDGYESTFPDEFTRLRSNINQR